MFSETAMARYRLVGPASSSVGGLASSRRPAEMRRASTRFTSPSRRDRRHPAETSPIQPESAPSSQNREGGGIGWTTAWSRHTAFVGGCPEARPDWRHGAKETEARSEMPAPGTPEAPVGARIGRNVPFPAPAAVVGPGYAHISPPTEKPGPWGLALGRDHENGVIPSLSRDLCAASIAWTAGENEGESSLDKLGMTPSSLIRPRAAMYAYPVLPHKSGGDLRARTVPGPAPVPAGPPVQPTAVVSETTPILVGDDIGRVGRATSRLTGYVVSEHGARAAGAPRSSQEDVAAASRNARRGPSSACAA